MVINWKSDLIANERVSHNHLLQNPFSQNERIFYAKESAAIAVLLLRS
jgi:hypothetical protein